MFEETPRTGMQGIKLEGDAPQATSGNLKKPILPVTPDEVRQATAMLVCHFALEKRLTQAVIRYDRMPGEEMERTGDDWELLEAVMKSLRFTDADRKELSDYCDKVKNTEVASRTSGYGSSIPRIPGVSSAAMYIHLDVEAKQWRLVRDIRQNARRIIRMRLTPRLKWRTIDQSPGVRCRAQEILLPSWRELSGRLGSKYHSSIRRIFEREIKTAALILVRNEDFF